MSRDPHSPTLMCVCRCDSRNCHLITTELITARTRILLQSVCLSIFVYASHKLNSRSVPGQTELLIVEVERREFLHHSDDFTAARRFHEEDFCFTTLFRSLSISPLSLSPLSFSVSLSLLPCVSQTHVRHYCSIAL